MKHLGFVGKSTEYIGYTHVEIINSSLRLSFNVPLTNNVEETFKKIVDNNYDLLMSTSAEMSFELENETLEILEKVIREQGIETEEFIQNTLIKFINQNGLDTTKLGRVINYLEENHLVPIIFL
jgi:glutathionylspermidine synthase